MFRTLSVVASTPSRSFILFIACICAIPKVNVPSSNCSVKYAERWDRISNGKFPTGRFACLMILRGLSLAMGTRKMEPSFL